MDGVWLPAGEERPSLGPAVGLDIGPGFKGQIVQADLLPRYWRMTPSLPPPWQGEGLFRNGPSKLHPVLRLEKGKAQSNSPISRPPKVGTAATSCKATLQIPRFTAIPRSRIVGAIFKMLWET
jgi:hypothetical protein